MSGTWDVRWYENRPEGFRLGGVARAGQSFFLLAADFDADGRDELAATDADGASVWSWATGAWTPVPTTPASAGSGLAAADLDGDGLLDLAVASSVVGGLQVAPGDGLGGFGAAIAVAGPSAATLVEPGDLDADGDTDLVAVGNSAILWYQNDGAGGFPSVLALGDASRTTDPK